MNLSGHFWTVGGLLGRTALPPRPPTSNSWSTTLEDPQAGTVGLSGWLSRPPGARDVVLLVHGLGGSSESAYMASAAITAAALGLASLRLSLRGADGVSGDLYHGGLTADLAAAARNLARCFDRVSVLGFSLGGHIALRYATRVDERAVTACAAVCSPLDLAAGADAMDQPVMAPYRRYVLRRLKANYVKTSGLAKVPTPAQEVRGVRTLRHWDALTVVPRFGFRDPDDYYARASVGSRLDRLRRPALLVAADNDPMVPPRAIRPSLEEARLHDPRKRDPTSGLTVRWLPRGGHLAFPRQVDLGLAGVARERSGADHLSQILLWLRQAADEGAELKPSSESGAGATIGRQGTPRGGLTA